MNVFNVVFNAGPPVKNCKNARAEVFDETIRLPPMKRFHEREYVHTHTSTQGGSFYLQCNEKQVFEKRRMTERCASVRCYY